MPWFSTTIGNSSQPVLMGKCSSLEGQTVVNSQTGSPLYLTLSVLD